MAEEELSTKVLIICALMTYLAVFVIVYLMAPATVLNPAGEIDFGQVALLSLYITGVIATLTIGIRWAMKAFADPTCLPLCDTPACPLPAPPAPAPAPAPAVYTPPPPPQPQVRTVYVPRTTYVAEQEIVTPEQEEIIKLRDADRTVEEARRQIAALQEGINEVIK